MAPYSNIDLSVKSTCYNSATTVIILLSYTRDYYYFHMQSTYTTNDTSNLLVTITAQYNIIADNQMYCAFYDKSIKFAHSIGLVADMEPSQN